MFLSYNVTRKRSDGLVLVNVFPRILTESLQCARACLAPGIQEGKIKSLPEGNPSPNKGEGWSKLTIVMQNDQVLIKASPGESGSPAEAGS